MQENTQISGLVEIFDKNHNLIFKEKNTILPFGKYKILSSLFSTKNEQLDGIKYLELYLSSGNNLQVMKNYNYLHKIKQIQINRKENIEVTQYDSDADKWVSFGNVLKKYKYTKNNYREKFLLEKISTQISDFYIFMNLFNLEEQSLKYNQLSINFNIPIFRRFNEQVFSFNLLVMQYGGFDVVNDTQNKVLIDEINNEILDPSITNQKSYDTQTWTSGLPFSQIQLPELVTVEDQLYLSWKYIFNFNELIS